MWKLKLALEQNFVLLGQTSCILSLTTALDGSALSTPRLGRFTPGKEPVPILQEAVLAPETF
jgi:hypothetical protein